VEESLCDYIHKTYVDAMASISYWEHNKRRKCYKCRKYGHMAKECDKICNLCHNYHTTAVCIFSLSEYYRRLYQAAKKIVEVNDRDKMREIIEITGPRTKKMQVKHELEKVITKVNQERTKEYHPVTQASFTIKRTFKIQHQEEYQYWNVNVEKEIERAKHITEMLRKTESKNKDAYNVRKERDELFKMLFECKQAIRTNYKNTKGRIYITDNHCLRKDANIQGEIKVIAGFSTGLPKGLDNQSGLHRIGIFTTDDTQPKCYEMETNGKYENLLKEYQKQMKQINEAINGTLRSKRLQAYNTNKNLLKENKQLQSKNDYLQMKNEQIKEQTGNIIQNKNQIMNNMRLKARKILNRKIKKTEKQYQKLKAARTLGRLKNFLWNQKKNQVYKRVKAMNNHIEQLQNYAKDVTKRYKNYRKAIAPVSTSSGKDIPFDAELVQYENGNFEFRDVCGNYY
jgi:hypothetical protein